MDIIDNSWNKKYTYMYQELEDKSNAYNVESIVLSLDNDIIVNDEDRFLNAYNRLVDIGEVKLANKWIKPYMNGF